MSRKSPEKKNQNKEQGQQIENSKKYSRQQSNYINDHIEYQWPKCNN